MQLYIIAESYHAKEKHVLSDTSKAPRCHCTFDPTPQCSTTT